MKPSAGSSAFCAHYSVHSGDERHFALLEGLSLDRFVGPDGLVLLLALLAAGELATSEVIETAKRVQIPGYELGRNLVGQQNLPEVLPPSLGQGCFCNRRYRS